MSYVPLRAKSSLKEYLLWRAVNFQKWFTYNQMKRWVEDYSELIGWNYEISTGDRKIRELTTEGKLVRNDLKGSGRCTHFVAHKAHDKFLTKNK